jgi:hypothetical protein
MSRITLHESPLPADAAGLNAVAPGGRFRRTVRFNLITGALATGVELLGVPTLAAPRLAVTFQAREIDALPNTAPERATLSAGSGGVVLSLPVARRIAGVRLHAAQADDQVAAFRFDGPVVSDQAIATGQRGSAEAVLGVADRQLVLRRTGLSGPLVVPAIKAVFVAYEAPNPRIGLALPADGAGAEFLPPELVTAAAAPLGAAFAAALAARLRRFAEDRQTPLPNPLAVDLILEADHPCLARITAFDLSYALTLRGLADSAEKQLLRFPGSRRTTETIELSLPPNAVVLAASIGLSEAAGPRAQQGAVSELDAAAVTASSEAVALAPGRPVGSRVEPADARVVIGAQAQLAAVEAATAVASLWEDDGRGLPGRKLTESAAVALQSGHPMSVPFVFSPPEALPAGPAWLVFSVERGRAALALDGGEAGAVAIQSGTGFSAVAAAGAQGGAVRLLYAPDAADEAEPSAGLAVSLAGTAIALMSDGGRDGFRADLTPQLSAMPRPWPKRIAIEIASERKGVVTVEPPLIMYQEVP